MSVLDSSQRLRVEPKPFVDCGRHSRFAQPGWAENPGERFVQHPVEPEQLGRPPVIREAEFIDALGVQLCE